MCIVRVILDESVSLIFVISHPNLLSYHLNLMSPKIINSCT